MMRKSWSSSSGGWLVRGLAARAGVTRAQQIAPSALDQQLPQGEPLLWSGVELSGTNEATNLETIQRVLFERFYQPASAAAEWGTVGAELRALGEAALGQLPAAAFGVANGMYHFFFFHTADAESTKDGTSAHLAIEDMAFAAGLFDVSLRFARCFDSTLDIHGFLMGMCQQKMSMLLLLLIEVGVASAALPDIPRAAISLREAGATFTAMKSVPYHALFSDLGWETPSDMALNDELYPRTFGPVWPREHVPFATFLEDNFETFKMDLEAIIAEEGLFEQLRQLERNAEGLAVWPPDTRGHIELIDTREDPPFKATCSFARATCVLLASRPEIAECPRAAAFLARLEPGAWLKPHLGNSRRLAAHLGLVIPDGPIELNVGPARRLQWEAGKAIVWDDTHVHDARHRGEHGTRYILQTFFCHPCEQPEIYQESTSSAVRKLVEPAACIHQDPMRAEVSRALRAEMDEREKQGRNAAVMTVPQGAPVSV